MIHSSMRAAPVAGDKAERHADDEADQRRADAHDERQARPVERAAEDVAAVFVGAEPVLARSAA